VRTPGNARSFRSAKHGRHCGSDGPSEDAAELAHRMGRAEVTRVVVTRQDGTLVGLFFPADLPAQHVTPGTR